MISALNWFLLDLSSVDLGEEDTTTDDYLIAQLLQKQFDKEFDENLQSVSLIFLCEETWVRISFTCILYFKMKKIF